MLRGGVVLQFLLVNDASHLWLVYVLTVVQFSVAALFEPARSAILPSVVASDDLVRANLLGSVTWSVMLAVGAVIGGVTAALFGITTALLIDSATFALSALLITQIRPQNKAKPADDPAGTKETQLGFRDGLSYIARRPATAATLLIKMGGSIGSIDALMVIYATQIFVIGENGTGSLGIMYAAFGLGAILGPIVLNRFNNGSVKTMRRLVIAGYACITLGWFAFGSAPMLAFAALAIVVKAMGSSIYWTYSSVILQKTVDDRFLGRLFAIDLAGFQLATVVSVTLTGWLIERVPTEEVTQIVFGTGIASLIPLIAWTLAIPWIERQALVERAMVSETQA
jgi:predicted MFS family arabinose efflux permease